MTAATPTMLELSLVIGVLLVVLALIVGPHVADWWERKANEGEPDFDDEERGGL